MKTVYPEFEGNELFISSSVKRTDPDRFLDNDSCWVNISVQELLKLVYENDLISEDKYSEYEGKEDYIVSNEVLDDILELDKLAEKRLIEKFMEKLKEEYKEEIEDCGGLRVSFGSGDYLIPGRKENEGEFI